jgi:DNA (cytosine-5)-methyltransferase 1
MLEGEIIVDNFAGGGGASEGIEQALGQGVAIAVNHDPEAIAMHQANHPHAVHLCGDVFDVNPERVCAGRRVGLAWFSPDCKHFSKAKGGKPVSKKIRGLAWVVIRWAKTVRPRVIILEHVEEFQTWGPLLPDGKPDPERRGFTFRRWMRELRSAGYEVEMRELRACDYGAPTTRRRLFIVARCDGQPIVWPEPTHGPGRLPYRTAAECIDWSLPCPSVFDRAKPLAEKTMARIARGIRKFVLESADPFIVPTTHAGDTRVHSVREPMRTITAAQRGEFALIAPTLVQTGYGERPGQAPRSLDLGAPLGTVVAGGAKHALVAAFLAKHYGGHEGPGSSLREPMSTITTRDHHSLVCALLEKHEKMKTGGIVNVRGESYRIVDVGMRMLEPRELYRAQGFADTYNISPSYQGKPLTKTAQVRMCGNSVSPLVARALVQANMIERRAVAA